MSNFHHSKKDILHEIEHKIDGYAEKKIGLPKQSDGASSFKPSKKEVTKELGHQAEKKFENFIAGKKK